MLSNLAAAPAFALALTKITISRSSAVTAVTKPEYPDAGLTPGVRPPPELLSLTFKKWEFHNVKQALFTRTRTGSSSERSGRLFHSSHRPGGIGCGGGDRWPCGYGR